MNITLYNLDRRLKKYLATFIIVLSCGVATGLTFLNYTTNYSPKGAITRFRGSTESEKKSDIDIPENYAKPVSEMLITTHNHVIAFSLIFGVLGFIFYFNSVITGTWKMVLIIEPLISIIVSFGSMWGMRFIHPNFVYLTAFSAILIYSSYFVMAVVCLYELLFKEKKV